MSRLAAGARRRLALLAMCSLASWNWAAAAESGAGLLPERDPVTLPSVGRVVFGFVVTVAIGAAAVYGLRRLLPKLSGRLPLAAGVRVIAQASLHAGLKLHVVEVEGRTVLVAEGKSGIALTVLPPSDASRATSLPPSSSEAAP